MRTPLQTGGELKCPWRVGVDCKILKGTVQRNQNIDAQKQLQRKVQRNTNSDTQSKLEGTVQA